MPKAPTVCTTAASTGSSLPPASRSAKKRSPEVGERRFAADVGRRVAEVVDDVVGVAAEAVERVHVVALGRRQQRRSTSSRWCRAGGSAARQCAYERSQAWSSSRGRPRGSQRPARRRAARRSAPSARRRPGTVPEPAKTSPGARRSTLAGRNGPVWRKRCDSANGVPRSMPWRCPVQRVDELLDLDVVGIAEAVDRARSRSSRARSRSVRQSIRPSRFGTGSSTYSTWQPAGAIDGSSSGRHGHEDRRVGHPRAVVEQRAERLVPLRGRSGCCGAPAPAGSSPRTPACQTTRRRRVAGPAAAARGGARSGSSVAVGDGQVGGADDGVGRDAPRRRPAARPATGPRRAARAGSARPASP